MFIKYPLSLFVSVILCTAFSVVKAQNIMQTTLGGLGADGANCIVKTIDGGYLVGGLTNSFGSGGDDILLVKTGPAGNPIWSQTYGGAGNEYIRAIRPTADGGYVIAGHSASFGNGDEAMFFKISSLGGVQWTITLGSTNEDRGCDIQEFPWGGYAICGSIEGLGLPGAQNNFIGRLSPTGALVWARAFGGPNSSSLFGLTLAPDNTIVATGPTTSFGAGSSDYQIVKYDTAGTRIWYRTLGTTANEHSRTVHNMNGGGFLVFGHSLPGIAGNWDNMVVRTDGNGNALWARAYGGANADMAMTAIRKSNGGFAMSSYSGSGSLGGNDVLVTQCDSLGSVQWRKVFGGAGNDDSPWGGKNIVEVSPGKYAIASGTSSFGPGGGDFYLLVVDSSAGNPCNEGTIPLATGPRIALTSSFSPPTVNILTVTPRVLPTSNPTILSNIQCRDTLSGVINIYTQVTAFNGCGSITVGSSSGFGVGDKVLIIQMKGADIDLSNSSNFGTINNYNQSGNYEVATISAIAGNTIILQNSLIRQYDPAALVQMISIAQPTNPYVQSTITAQDWNGTTGGVLVLDHIGVLSLGANLDVKGKGFRGGIASQNFFSGCSSAGYFFPQPSTFSGEKGEGITDQGSNFGAGEGALANGGGGGNHVNAGGAGGGNGGLGGEGGYQWTGGCAFIPIGGDPGRVLTYSNIVNKVFLGGGGGGPQQDNSNSTPGVAGGGIIFLLGDTIEGNGFSLIAAGADQNLTATNDGGGGGGAGGVILGDIGYWGSTPLNLDVTGGKGGNCQIAHGPGGGGGGGVIWLSPATIPGNLTINLAGGNAGADGSPNNHGALAGSPGQSIMNLVVPESNIPAAPPVFSLGNDTILCQGDTLLLDPGTTIGQFTWSTGDTTPTITVDTSGIYWLEISTGAACIASDTIQVSVAPVPVPNLGNDTTICQGTQIVLDPGIPFGAIYQWSNGATTTTLPVTSTGLFWVEVTDSTGTCAGRDSTNITVAILPIVNLGNDTTICGTGPFVLNAGNPGSSYAWSNGSTSQTLSVSTTGTYSVTVTSSSGCIGSDAIQVQFAAIPIVNLGPDRQICAGQNVQLDAGNPGAIYNWSPSITTSQIAVVNATGNYSVTVTTGQGCTASDAVNVTVFPNPTVNLGPDIDLCTGQTTVLDAGNPGSTYLWSNGLTSQTITATTTGNYSVTVTTANGCVGSDIIRVTIHPTPNVNVGQDRTICAGQTTNLSAGNQGASYLWSTGETTSIIQVSTPGQYWAQVTTSFGCVGRDTMVLTVAPLPIVNLGNDALLCQGDSALLDAGNTGSSFAWSTGASSQTILVTTGGPYSVTVTNADGCKTNDRIVFTERGPFAYDLGPDTTICGNPPFRIGMNVQFGQYLWQDGNTQAIIAANETGLYSVMVDNECFTVNDTIMVTFIQGTGPFAPNAFTPNGDFLNDEFGFVGIDIENFEMAIFDRWGKQIFFTQNPNDTWDGNFGGVACPEGVYVYRVKFMDCRGILTDRGGSITLIR